MDDETSPAPVDADLIRRVDALTVELELLRALVGRIEREVAATRPLVSAVRALHIWDYTPYGVAPGSDWVAIDRTAASELLAALAKIDHWRPWSTPIEARPRS